MRWTAEGLEALLQLRLVKYADPGCYESFLDTLDVWYFPPKLPELNPLEGCWDRLKEWFKHRLVLDLQALKTEIQRGLPTVEEPNIWNYLCP